MSSVSFDGRLEIILHCLGDDLEDELQLSLAANDQVLPLVQIKNLKTGKFEQYRTNLLSVVRNLLYFSPVHGGVLLDLPPEGGQHGGVHNLKLQVVEGNPTEQMIHDYDQTHYQHLLPQNRFIILILKESPQEVPENQRACVGGF